MKRQPAGNAHQFLATLPGLRRLNGHRARHFADRLAPPMAHFLGALLVPGSLHNTDDGDFIFQLCNPWLAQEITGVQVWLDGLRLRSARVSLGDGARQSRHPASPQQPLRVALKKKALTDGLHFLALELHGTRRDLKLPAVSLTVKAGVANLPLTAPEASGPLVPCPVDDLAWCLTRADREQIFCDYLLETTTLVAADPTARLGLPASPALTNFAERFPDAAAELRSLVAAGRIQPLMTFLAEPAAAFLSGESLVRHLVAAQRAHLATCGAPALVAWLPTSPGAPASLPQLLRKSGLTALALANGLPAAAPPDFLWEGIDGTRIKTHGLAAAPSDCYPTPNGGHGDTRLSPAPDLFNPASSAIADPRPKALPADHFAALPDRGLPLITGGLEPAWTGALGPRPELRRLLREAERWANDIERLPLITGSAAADAPDVWSDLLPLQHHSIVAGLCTDDVAADVERALRDLIYRAEQFATRQLRDVAHGVPPAADAAGAFVVANTLPFWREQLVRLPLVAQNGRLPQVFDGVRVLERQTATAERFADGTVKRADVLVRVAVPPLGYRVLWLTPPQPSRPAAEPRAVATARDDILENGWLTVEFNLGNGTIRRITDRHRERVFDLPNAGLLTFQHRRPNIDDPVGPGVRSSAFDARHVEITESGPLRATLQFSGSLGDLPATLTYSLSQTSRVVRCDVSIDCRRRRGALALRIPRPADASRILQEIPFGHVVREGGAFPALGYLDMSGPAGGLAVLTQAAAGFEIPRRVALLHLASSIERVHFLDEGAGADLGGRQTFTYGLYPHAGDAAQADVYRRAAELNAPLRQLLIDGQLHPAGQRSRATSLFSLSPDSIDVTACYREPDGSTVVRLVERGGKDTYAELKPKWKHGAVESTDLLGNAAKPYQPGRWRKRKGVIDLRFRAFEVKTMRFAPPE
jgi:alpha-mannosidase